MKVSVTHKIKDAAGLYSTSKVYEPDVAAYFIDTARNQADLSDALRAAVRAAEKEDGNV